MKTIRKVAAQVGSTVAELLMIVATIIFYAADHLDPDD